MPSRDVHGQKNGNAKKRLWTVVGMMSACFTTLTRYIDQKRELGVVINFSGYLLAHINTCYMKHRGGVCPRKSPSRYSCFLLFENSSDRITRVIHQ